MQFGLSQAQANYWIHRLLAALQGALSDLGLAPEREAGEVATSPLVWEGGTLELTLDGTERRRQRRQDPRRQQEHYSGKKKAHTDKNLLLVNATSGKVIYLSPTPWLRWPPKAAASALVYYRAEGLEFTPHNYRFLRRYSSNTRPLLHNSD